MLYPTMLGSSSSMFPLPIGMTRDCPILLCWPIDLYRRGYNLDPGDTGVFRMLVMFHNSMHSHTKVLVLVLVDKDYVMVQIPVALEYDNIVPKITDVAIIKKFIHPILDFNLFIGCSILLKNL